MSLFIMLTLKKIFSKNMFVKNLYKKYCNLVIFILVNFQKSPKIGQNYVPTKNPSYTVCVLRDQFISYWIRDIRSRPIWNRLITCKSYYANTSVCYLLSQSTLDLDTLDTDHNDFPFLFLYTTKIITKNPQVQMIFYYKSEK